MNFNSTAARAFLIVLLALPLLCLAACTAQYPLNPKAEKIDREAPYRAKLAARDRSHETLLILAFSGGGTRAASLSYGILEALDLVEVPAPRKARQEAHAARRGGPGLRCIRRQHSTASYFGLVELFQRPL